MRERWIEEEKGWAQLPPRAWPPRQPKATEAQGLRDQLRADRCPLPGQPAPDKCLRTMFDLATALAFGKGDPPEGVAMYRAMSEAGDLDSTVALAVCLVEDVAGSDDEHGVRLLRAACARGSAQAWYELGTLLLVGGAGLEEDEPAAFDCFRQAAEQGHSAGMFMMADCLLEGVGCETDAARAVPLLHASAERGHRGARQHLRQLLDGNWWGFDGAAGPTFEHRGSRSAGRGEMAVAGVHFESAQVGSQCCSVKLQAMSGVGVLQASIYPWPAVQGSPAATPWTRGAALHACPEQIVSTGWRLGREAMGCKPGKSATQEEGGDRKALVPEPGGGTEAAPEPQPAAPAEGASQPAAGQEESDQLVKVPVVLAEDVKIISPRGLEDDKPNKARSPKCGSCLPCIG
ncbi:unnamed protein product [Prorocentrum cordatum]|uniref:Uncharacterized protein n=1 Tax=Prorocentrum cordatum TaxID=2364126 RepID=A0ABN9W6C4_9DINO|nr:unnamed protein product [Polarella glacialis]